MSNFTKRAIACILSAFATISSAQEVARDDELFGQESTSQAVMPAVPAARQKTLITNRQATAAPNVSRTDEPRVPGAQADAVPSRGMRERERHVSTADMAKERTEFQKFVFDSTQQVLPVFGANFFANAPSTFAPILNSPVPADYLLGPGDELLIRGWGTIDIDFRATIDRNGTITIPTIGSVVLAGVKAGDADAVIRNAIGTMYRGVTVSVNFGQLRAITVYVVGQAKRPGTYTVSSLSTLVTALFASGGPNGNGSMRKVQVKRAGKVVAELDLYAFIAKGDKSGDVKLQDGDSIYIPPAGGFVALVGKVNSPAIYELKSGGESIESILDIAGGLPVLADPRRAFLERIDANRNRPRSVEQFALDIQGLKRSLKDGDLLNVISISAEFSNAVVLRGNVGQPVRAPFREGMRISDLIPSKEYLITRESVRRQNDAMATSGKAEAEGEKVESIAARIGNLIDEINWDYAVVERVNREDLSVKLIPFNLGKVFSQVDGPDNIQLQAGDTVTVFSQDDVAVPVDKRRVFVRVEGEVNVPGVYQMTAGETLQTLLAKAGGPTSNAYLFGTAFFRETARKEQELNLEKAANRLENQLRNEQSRGIANLRAQSGVDAQAAVAQREQEARLAREAIDRFRQLKPTGRIAFGLKPDERSFARLPQIKLEDGDRLMVPAKPDFINVFGAVAVEASMLWRRNMRVNDYLKTAGLSADADLENVFVLRVDGTVISRSSNNWFLGAIGGIEVMPGDSIVVPEKFDKESAWTKFTKGTREWAQIFANFGLGAAAIKTLRD